MLKRISLSLLTALFIAGTFSLTTQAQDFEGVIHFEIPEMAEQGMGEMPYMVKGNKGRMEINHMGQKNAMLMLPDESKMVMIIEKMQGYIEMDTNKETSKSDLEETPDTEMTNTGQTKTIAGRTCEVWRMESEDGTFETCMANGMGTFMMPQNKMQKNQAPEWAKTFAEKGAMPLEIVEIQNGSKSIKMKATKIEEKSLSDDLFKIPEGYRDMSGMMRGMQNRN
ncbi:DUF4412 domain-containing protein [Fodinibius sp. Rm-B-1B1-1]|uniref:DUF4412 domain-containing protein n=1 Tax=Fodinibius alkaliphilus TaxID=3140241 RepID=UPI003159C407